MQSQRNGIGDNDDVELPLAHIRKMQNIADVGTKASTGAEVGRRLDVSNRNEIQKRGMSCIIG